MKKLLVFLFLLSLLSCSTTYYSNYYKYTIKKCIRSANDSFGELVYKTIDKDKETRVIISDDYFDIQMTQIDGGLRVYLNNKSKDEVFIDWDKSWFIDDKGQKSILVRSFTEFLNPPHKQKPTQVYDESRLDVYVNLSEYVSRDTNNNLKFENLLNHEISNDKSMLEANSKDLLNKIISVNLALVHNEMTVNYQVDLKINEYGIYQKE